MINVNVLCAAGLIRGFKDVGQARIGPCEVDHRQSHRNQDAQNCQSESHEARAGPLPAQGEALTFKHRCHGVHKAHLLHYVHVNSLRHMKTQESLTAEVWCRLTGEMFFSLLQFITLLSQYQCL